MALRTVGVRLLADVAGFTGKMKQAQGSVKDFQKDLLKKSKLDADTSGVIAKLHQTKQPLAEYRRDMSRKEKLQADVSAFTAQIRSAQKSVQQFHKELGNSAAAGQLDNLADRAGVMGLGLAAGFGYAVKAAADFDKQMSAVSAATHASAADMKLLKAAALEAGKSTQYSATEAAQGITELSKAGVSTADVLSGGLKGALSLAAAGQLDVGEAAETAASAMTQFKLSGDKIPHVADLLSAAAGKAQGSVHDMGAALNQTGLVASQTGLSIEETTGGLAAFASAGLTGSDAGTSFKQMLLMLQAPSDKTQALMDELGITMYDNQGKFMGLSKFAGVLRDKLKDLTPQARSAAMAQIFGADATRAASVMYENGAEGIQKWIDSVNDAGYAQQTASKLTDNLAGDMERLKGSLETMAIEAGGGANSGLRILVKTLGALVEQLGTMPKFVSGFMVVAVGLGGALVLGAVAWVKYRRAVAETRAELEQMGPAGVKASTAIGKLTSLAGTIGVWSLALETASAALNNMATHDADVDKLTASLLKMNDATKPLGETQKIFGEDWDKLGRIATFAEQADHGFGKFVNSTLTSIPIIGDAGSALGNFANRLMFGTDARESAAALSDLDAGFVEFMNQTHDATRASAYWNEIISKSGLTTDQLAEKLPNAWKQLQKLQVEQMNSRAAAGLLSEATTEVTAVQKEYKTAAEAAAGAINGERAAFDELSDAMKAETDPVFGLLDAQDKLTKAQKAASKAIKDGGKDTTEAKEATRDLAMAAINLQEKTGSLGAEFDGKLSPALIATLKAGKLTDSQIKELGKQFTEARKRAEEYDDDYAAVTTAPGAKEAKKDLDNAYTAANHFAGPYVAKLSIQGKGPVDAALADIMIKQRALATGLSYSSAKGAVQKDLDRNSQKAYAVGGWTGPGSMYEPAGVVHADEFVIKKSSRQKIEQRAPGLLDSMNATGKVPGYAGGGPVMKVSVAKTRVPSEAEALAVVQPPGPPSGQTYRWIMQMVAAAFPGLKAISTFRQGATTLSGNRSHHADGDAVDYPASKGLAQYWNKKFGKITDELITPWNSLNLYRGKPHKYTGAVWNQHNFAGGNAHDHIAVTGRYGGAGLGLGAAVAKGAVGMWIARAIGLAHVPSSWAGPLSTLIMRESGGNPKAQNNWDSNAKAGHPSKGLMQTIPSTFSHYRLKSLPNNIFDPVANIVAGIRYIEARYGSIFNVQQANANKSPKGYAAGGLVGHTAMATGGVIREPIVGMGRSGRTYSFGERGPETVIPGYAGGGLVNVATSTGTAPVRGSHMDTLDAAMRAREAIYALTAALKENGRTFSLNTTKGRANVNSLMDGVKAAQAVAKAKYEETGSVNEANKTYSAYISSLDIAMKRMKLSVTQRKALLKAYSEKPTYDIPAAASPGNSASYVAMAQARVTASGEADDIKKAFAWTKPTFVTTTESGRAEFSQLFSFLGAAQAAAQTEYELSGSSKEGMKVYDVYINQLRAVLTKSGMKKAEIDKLLKLYGRITLTSNRWGGLYEHAAGGVLKDAMVAGVGTRYAWAEPSTGGELFAPKKGNLAKTRSEVSWAVQNWWGGDVSWGKKGNAPMVINAPIAINLGGETIQRQVRLEVDTALGEVVSSTVYQTA